MAKGEVLRVSRWPAARGLMPAEGLNLVLAGVLLSITLNPVVFAATDRICLRIEGSPAWRARCEENGNGPLALLRAEKPCFQDRGHSIILTPCASVFSGAVLIPFTTVTSLWPGPRRRNSDWIKFS